MFKQKLQLSESYKGVKQLNSDVVLIKSAEHNAIMSQDDYGLKEVLPTNIIHSVTFDNISQHSPLDLQRPDRYACRRGNTSNFPQGGANITDH